MDPTHPREHRCVLLRAALALPFCLLTIACDSSEAPQLNVPVRLDSSGIVTVETDLGYQVELTRARLALEDMTFTIAGEVHASLGTRLLGVLLPHAHAHPGHFQGGEITGELPGRFIAEWADGAPSALGTGILLAGNYKSANFKFAKGALSDGLPSDDPLIGHTAILQGTATKDEQTVQFTVVLDAPDDRALIGAPCELTISKGSPASLGLRLLTMDPEENDTLFDELDFLALDTDADGELSLGADSSAPLDAAYQTLRRTFLTHDHFDVRLSDETGTP